MVVVVEELHILDNNQPSCMLHNKYAEFVALFFYIATISSVVAIDNFLNINMILYTIFPQITMHFDVALSAIMIACHYSCLLY